MPAAITGRLLLSSSLPSFLCIYSATAAAGRKDSMLTPWACLCDMPISSVSAGMSSVPPPIPMPEITPAAAAMAKSSSSLTTASTPLHRTSPRRTAYPARRTLSCRSASPRQCCPVWPPAPRKAGYANPPRRLRNTQPRWQR